MDPNQEKLMEMVVGKVLEKHKVKIAENKLTQEEKEEIKYVVEKIKQDVERFLQNQQKVKTEKDFAQKNQSTMTNQHQVTENKVQQTPNPRRVYSQPNDINAVKFFYQKKQK